MVTTKDTFLIHGNDITGELPTKFCPFQLGIDCLKVSRAGDSSSCYYADNICFYTEKSATLSEK